MNFPHASVNEKIYSMKPNKCAICSEKADKAQQQLRGAILTSCGSFAGKQCQSKCIPKNLGIFLYTLLIIYHCPCSTTESPSHRQRLLATDTSNSKQIPQLPIIDWISEHHSKRKTYCKYSLLPYFSSSEIPLFVPAHRFKQDSSTSKRKKIQHHNKAKHHKQKSPA